MSEEDTSAESKESSLSSEEQKLIAEPDEAAAPAEKDEKGQPDEPDYLDALQRLQAEFENYRKRMTREGQARAERAVDSLITKLLPVLDTMDLALSHDPSGSLEQVRSAMRDVLNKEGLERIDAAGTAFDPSIHDAVEHEAGDGHPEVVEVMRSGYRLNGRVLRPAMVKVKGS